MQQAQPIASFQEGMIQVLSIARSGLQPNQDLLSRGFQLIQMLEEPLKAICLIAELAGFDHLPFFHRQAAHHTGLHANINTYHISQPGSWRYWRGRFVRHRLCPPFPRKSVSANIRLQRANHLLRTCENSSWIGSLPECVQVLQQAQWSLPILMDGELSVGGGHSLLGRGGRTL